MAQGRCSGCGKVGTSAKAMLRHTVSCDAYAEIYSKNPALALTPEEEYIRWRTQEGSSDAKEVRKDIQRQEIFRKMHDRIDQQHTRWATPKDILDD